MSRWVKKNYPDVKSDLCTCFIERNLSLAKVGGFASLVTSDTCMYLSSFVAMRASLVESNTILTFVDTRGTNAHPDVFDANAIWVLRHGRLDGYKGSYFKLNHRIPEKAGALLEAIQNPDCGWFYRRDAETFKQIPGTPIAYWAPVSMGLNYENAVDVDDISEFTGSQNITADNAKFLRLWWEISHSAVGEGSRWISYAKGGDYRKWFGNMNHVVDWSEDARLFYETNSTSNKLQDKYCFKEGITYTDITSGGQHFRYLPDTGAFDKAGPSICCLGDNLYPLLGLFNSSVAALYYSALNPTIHLQVKDVKQMPINSDCLGDEHITHLSKNSVSLSKSDWDTFETSRDFKRHPLV